MLVSIIPIGNSKGIRLPKTVLDECSVSDKMELKVQNKEIILRPVNNKPREGWKKEFHKMHKNEDDKLVIESNIDSTNFDWDW
jgi:antitoxin MazE